MIQISTALAKDLRRARRRARIRRWLGLLIPALQLRFSPGQAVAIGNAWLNGTASNIDSFILEIRSGSQPATADLAPTGTVLASITLPADAFSAASSPGAVVSKAGTWQDASADATGTAGHFRIRASGDAGTTNNTDRRIDGACTATGGGGELELQNLSIAITQQITVNTFDFTIPKQ